MLFIGRIFFNLFYFLSRFQFSWYSLRQISGEMSCQNGFWQLALQLHDEYWGRSWRDWWVSICRIIFEGNGPIGFMGYVSPTQWNEPSAHSERTSKTRLRFNCYSVYGETVSTGRIRPICQYWENEYKFATIIRKNWISVHPLHQSIVPIVRDQITTFPISKKCFNF